MSRLFKFEIKRMKYKKIHIILPLIIISIGLVGIITGNAFNENLTSKVKMLNIFQAYTQFSFIFLGFVYIYLFTEDSIKEEFIIKNTKTENTVRFKLPIDGLEKISNLEDPIFIHLLNLGFIVLKDGNEK